MHCLQYLISKENAYAPEYLFEDVTNTVQAVHLSGQLHNIICSDLGNTHFVVALCVCMYV